MPPLHALADEVEVGGEGRRELGAVVDEPRARHDDPGEVGGHAGGRLGRGEVADGVLSFQHPVSGARVRASRLPAGENVKTVVFPVSTV